VGHRRQKVDNILWMIMEERDHDHIFLILSRFTQPSNQPAIGSDIIMTNAGAGNPA